MPDAGDWGSDHGDGVRNDPGAGPTKGNEHAQHDRRRRTPRLDALVFGVAVAAMVTLPAAGVGAVSEGSISPTTLSASGQKFEVTYSGRTTRDQGDSLVVEECIADDRKPGFDPASDCSSLSRQFFFGVPESGTVTYGGQPANPTAPFVGTDPENGAWSVCGPEAGAGNHDRGYLRLSESPDDLTSDFFVPFTCAAAGAPEAAGTGGSGATGVAVAGAVGVVVLTCVYAMVRTRKKSPSSVAHRPHQSRTTTKKENPAR